MKKNVNVLAIVDSVQRIRTNVGDPYIRSQLANIEVHAKHLLYQEEETDSAEILPEEKGNGLQYCPFLTIASCSLETPEGLKKCLGNMCMMYDANRDDCRLARPYENWG